MKKQHLVSLFLLLCFSLQAQYSYHVTTGLFIDTEQDGLITTTSPINEDAEIQARLPFDFHFFDKNYLSGTTISIGNNGAVVLDSESKDEIKDDVFALNTSLPDKELDVAIYPFWLDFSSKHQVISSTTFGEAPYRIFLIQWDNQIVDEGQALPMKFQLQLHERDDKIVFAYAGLHPDWYQRATVGIQNMDATVSQKYVEVGEERHKNDSHLAIVFTPLLDTDKDANLASVPNLQLAYPNPTSGELYLDIINPNARQVVISCFDQLGRLVSSKDFGETARQASLVFEGLETLPDGQYSLEILIGQDQFSKTIVKSK